MEAAWPAGFRLDTARLAGELGVSTSPVRDSLNHLAGERMVDFEMGAGFYVPRTDERRLCDLLALNLRLLLTRSEEHTSELQSLMRISYADFCLQKQKTNRHPTSDLHSSEINTNILLYQVDP